jgi:CheY-like chemotaxis protein
METKQKPTVLVVDDDEALQRMLQHWGEESAVTVISALTTDEGLAKFEEVRPMIVAMDGQIPGSVDSLELVHTMRARGFRDHLIAISSYPEVRKKFMEEGSENGCNMECEKSELARVLEDVLDLHL